MPASLLKPLFATGAAFLLSVSSYAADLSQIPSGEYTLDPTHAYINFQYSHLGFSNPVIGFDDFDITLSLDVDDPTKSSAALEIKVDSLDTGSEIFHDHLTSADWFDTATHAKITFQSTEVTANDDGTFAMTGDLTIKDVTKPVTLAVVVNGAMPHPRSKKPTIGISATGDILRSDWDLGNLAPFVSDEVKLIVEAEFNTEG